MTVRRSKKRVHVSRRRVILMTVMFVIAAIVLISPFIIKKGVTNYYHLNSTQCFSVVNMISNNYTFYASLINETNDSNIILIVNNLKRKDTAHFILWIKKLRERDVRMFVLKGLNDTFMYSRYLPYSHFVIETPNFRLIGSGSDEDVIENNLKSDKKNIIISNVPISDNETCYFCDWISSFSKDNVIAFVSPSSFTMNVSGLIQFAIKQNPLKICLNEFPTFSYLNSKGVYWIKTLR